MVFVCFFFSSRRRHTRCALVTGVQTCALPISLSDLESLPVSSSNGGTQILGSVTRLSRGMSDAVVTHRDIMSVVDIYATPQGHDLGAVAADIQKIVDASARARKSVV